LRGQSAACALALHVAVLHTTMSSKAASGAPTNFSQV
jgi:hypothetical protein